MDNKFTGYFAKRKKAKLEQMRKKNWDLTQQGINPHKGWGTMIDTGSGGLNNMNRDNQAQNFLSKEIDNKQFFIEVAKRIRKN